MTMGAQILGQSDWRNTFSEAYFRCETLARAVEFPILEPGSTRESFIIGYKRSDLNPPSTAPIRCEGPFGAGPPGCPACATESIGSRPVIDSSFALERLADAFRHHESGRHFGKIVLEICA